MPSVFNPERELLRLYNHLAHSLVTHRPSIRSGQERSWPCSGPGHTSAHARPVANTYLLPPALN